MKWMMTVDPAKRPTAEEALSHYWILDRFADLQSDNLLLNNGNDEESSPEFGHLSEVQNNMAQFKKFHIFI